MVATKVSLTKEQAEFLKQYEALGFSDRSALVRAAIDRLRTDIKRRRLEESGRLYAEVYADDSELSSLTEAATEDWPE